MFTLAPDGHRIHPLLLNFREPALEAEYRSYHRPNQFAESRLGLYVVILSWAIYLLFAPLLVPPSIVPTVQRLAAGTLALFVLAQIVCYFERLEAWRPFIMLLCAVAAFSDVVIKVYLNPALGSTYFFPAMLLLGLWNFALAGNRFIHAIVLPLLFSGIYLTIFVSNEGARSLEFTNTLFYLACAMIMGLVVSWYKEYQGRIIFLTRRALDEERQLHLRRSLHDSLTGLPNRDLLRDRIDQQIRKVSRNKQLNAGIFIDLDGFKTINDTLGHHAGDDVLKEVARRFSAAVRESDTVARISGDEFFVLACDISSREAAVGLARKLLACLEAPVALHDGTQTPCVGASLGVCLFPADKCDADTVMRRADGAMYEIKRTTKGAIGYAE
jgi:diguanylate cyclase (GGDEF)-like protein